MKKKNTAQKTETVETVASFPKIYVGVSIPKLGLKQFTVFADGFTDVMQDYIAKYPLLEQLIVPISKFAEAKAALADKTSAKFIIQKQLLNSISLTKALGD